MPHIVTHPASRLLATAAAILALTVLGACSDSGPTGVGAAPPPDAASRVLPTTTPHQSGAVLPSDLVTRSIGERCVDCHEDVVASYESSGMHDSVTLPSGAGSVEEGLVGTRVVDRDSGMTVLFDARDGHYVQRVTYVDPTGVERAAFEARVDLVIGSGHATRSYFQIVEGRFLELPLTWYRQLDGLALSPGAGFDERVLRMGNNLCVTCHVGNIEPIRTDWSAGFRGELSLGVSCERCHGPSDDHIVSGDPRTTVNPARLSGDQQAQLCDQCHLSSPLTVQARDRTIASYVPGADLARWIGVFGPEGSEAKPLADIAGHGERLRLSRCSTVTAASGSEPLTCTSCHNPHHGFQDADAAAETDRGCLVCHDSDACHGDEAAREGKACFTCHMAVAPAGDVAHTKVTDHWIRRTLPATDAADRRPVHPGDMALSGVGLRNLLDPESESETALLFAARAYAQGAETARAVFGEDAEPWRLQAFVLAGAELARSPDSPEALLVRGKMLTLGDRADEARPLLEKALAARPDAPGVHAALGYAAAERADFAEAERHLGEAGRIDPFDEDVAMSHARVLVETKRRPEALAVLDTIRARLGPSLPRAFLASEIASRGQDPEAALRHVYDVALFRPYGPDVQTRIGDLLAVLGEPERARAHVVEALRIDPTYEMARKMLDAIEEQR